MVFHYLLNFGSWHQFDQDQPQALRGRVEGEATRHQSFVLLPLFSAPCIGLDFLILSRRRRKRSSASCHRAWIKHPQATAASEHTIFRLRSRRRNLGLLVWRKSWGSISSQGKAYLSAPMVSVKGRIRDRRGDDCCLGTARQRIWRTVARSTSSLRATTTAFPPTIGALARCQPALLLIDSPS
jgi:hypothetical protein